MSRLDFGSLFSYLTAIMENRLLDIIIEIAEIVRKRGGLPSDREELVDDFNKKGYSTEEIERAIQWTEGNLSENPSAPMRILSSSEKFHLTTDGYGTLLKLRNLGLLTDEHLELIIARSILLGEGPIDADGIRSMATVFLFDLRGSESKFSIYLDTETGQIEN